MIGKRLSRLAFTIRSRLFLKMLIIYSMLTLVPLIVVSAMFYYQSSQLMEKEQAEAAQQQLDKIAAAIDGRLYEAKKRLLELGDQALVQDLVKLLAVSEPPRNSPERKMAGQAAQDLLAGELSESRQKIGDYVENLYLISNNGEVFAAESQQGLQFSEAYSLLPFEFDRMAEWAFFTDYQRMVCVLNLYADHANGGREDPVGYLALAFDAVAVAELYTAYKPGSFYITNGENLIVSATNLAEIGSLLDNRRPGNQLAMKQKSQYADFQFVAMAEPGAGDVVKKQTWYAVIVTLVAWLAVLGATYAILKRVTNPIQRLTRLMRKAEREEYQLIGNVGTVDEIAALCQGYNQLVARTEELIAKNYKTELVAREAELRAIRMYINPHFLYNSMEYISIMSQSPEKVQHVPDIVQKLASIFRFSILPGASFVTLQTELLFAEKYLHIYKYRFGERLSCEIMLPAMLRNAAVPRLLLQPLVENAIIHGIDLLPEGGLVRIEATEADYQLVIRISNHCPPAANGGESGEGRRGHRRQPGLGSGLDNVNARLGHHFGKGYGAKLDIANQRAVVTLVMPIQLWMEEESKHEDSHSG